MKFFTKQLLLAFILIGVNLASAQKGEESLENQYHFPQDDHY
tara:strand:- start:478 stop:603 length:126 start_codon:yes stop_codon:yes gene_type:complete